MQMTAESFCFEIFCQMNNRQRVAIYKVFFTDIYSRICIAEYQDVLRKYFFIYVLNNKLFFWVSAKTSAWIFTITIFPQLNFVDVYFQQQNIFIYFSVHFLNGSQDSDYK